MRATMRRHSYRGITRRYRQYLSLVDFRRSLAVSVAFFIVGIVANAYAIVFATEHASNPVTDIVLSNVPVFDVDGLFVYGTLLCVLFTALLFFSHPKRLPFAFYAAGLFFIVRAIFVTMTHVGNFEPHAISDFGYTINRMFFGDDLFFSGHTGLPFLAALAFWREPTIRWFYLLMSIFFGVVVLLGHMHYTIDVFSAFFITYGIFHMAQHFFPKENALFYSDAPRDITDV